MPAIRYGFEGNTVQKNHKKHTRNGLCHSQVRRQVRHEN